MTESTPTRRSTYRTVLRHRPLLLVWAGGAVSTLGNHFFQIALMWFTFATTRSSLEVACIAVVYQLTYVVVGPVAGVLADRWDRRRTMIVCDLIRMAMVAAFAVFTWRMGYSFPIALGTIVLEQCVARFFGPSRQAYIPTLVDRDDLVTANGLMSGTGQAMGLGGQAIAGFVIAAIGALAGFVIDAVSFGVSALALSLVRLRTTLRVEPDAAAAAPRDRKMGRSGFWTDMRAGWGILARTPVIFTLVLFATLLNALYAMIEPAMPAYVLDQLHTGAWAYGLVGSFQFGGGLLGGFLAGSVAQRVRAGRLIIGVGIVSGAAVLAVGLLHTIALALVIWGFWGFTLSIMGVVEQSLEQILIPQEYLARVLAIISSVGMALMPLGSLVGGYLANRLGPGPLYVLVGLGFTAIAIVMLFNTNIRTAHIGHDSGMESQA